MTVHRWNCPPRFVGAEDTDFPCDGFRQTSGSRRVQHKAWIQVSFLETFGVWVGLDGGGIQKGLEFGNNINPHGPLIEDVINIGVSGSPEDLAVDTLKYVQMALEIVSW